MKKQLFALAIAAVFAACNQGSKTASASGDSTSTAITPEMKANATAIKFEEETFDFGKIKQGEKVTHNFGFTNTGDKPLIITEAHATCGCTVPEPPKEPIKPGEKGVIKVVFNSEGKSGLQDKQVYVSANTNPQQTVVHLIGEVSGK